MVGVGGAGMRNIARLLMARGIAVTGSDLKDSRGLAALRTAGATVYVGHRRGQVGAPDVVVVSGAIPEAPGENWRAVDMALRQGRRGLFPAGRLWWEVSPGFRLTGPRGGGRLCVLRECKLHPNQYAPHEVLKEGKPCAGTPAP